MREDEWMKKRIFFDLDGTLCRGYGLELETEIIEAFEHLRETDVQPVIATGRSYYEVKPILQTLQVNDYILSDGCYAFFNGKEIVNETFSSSEIEAILSVAAEMGVAAGYFNQQGYAVTEMTGEVSEHGALLGQKNVPIAPTFYQTQPVNFMNLYLDSKKEDQVTGKLEKIADRIRFSPLAVSLLPKNSSKGTAIKKVLDHCATSESVTYAFGDNDNDLTMFQLVDHSVAMKQATEGLKQQATYIAKSEQGVIEGLKHYGLIS
jgi:Cof subfamily protein (haloacid dehalogenase superfamily)